MTTATYEPVANVTLGSNIGEVTISNLSGYRNYVVEFVGSLSSAESIRVIFNTTTNDYGYRGAYTNQAGVALTLGGTSQSFGQILNSDTTRFSFVGHLINATSTDTHKSLIGTMTKANQSVQNFGIQWANTAAVTSIRFYLGTAKFSSGSRFAMYGLVG